MKHSRQFVVSTGFPQGASAHDGCHIEVYPTEEHATDYYNYEGWNSSILLAAVDHQYRSMYVKVGLSGGNHDTAVIERTRLRGVLASKLFRLEVKNGIGV